LFSAHDKAKRLSQYRDTLTDFTAPKQEFPHFHLRRSNDSDEVGLCGSSREIHGNFSRNRSDSYTHGYLTSQTVVPIPVGNTIDIDVHLGTTLA